MSTIIKVENLSKQYRLGQVGTGTISNDLTRWWHRVRGKEDPFLKIGEENDRTKKGSTEFVWALKDINFSVKDGQVLGIIGRNGAGKSTLLKILSRTTAPTTGTVKIRGRIASLLEVGTGFHPELSGRQNVYLNGAILGMTKAEIKSKFDEIVDFAGVERYIDTPVKRYSSGMYVRLAFGVAAHLEPEILIVDEVLAVGDAEFQRKCLGKMKDVSVNQGRTVLFVSHNMAAVKTLCTQAIVLEHGQTAFAGNTDETVSYYFKGNDQQEPVKQFGDNYQFTNFTLNEIAVRPTSGTGALTEKKAFELITDIDVHTNGLFHITYHLHTETGEALFSLSNTFSEIELTKGHNRLSCLFPAGFLLSGTYYLSFFFVKDKLAAEFVERDILSFVIIDAEREAGTWMGREPGFIQPKLTWKAG